MWWAAAGLSVAERALSRLIHPPPQSHSTATTLMNSSINRSPPQGIPLSGITSWPVVDDPTLLAPLAGVPAVHRGHGCSRHYRRECRGEAAEAQDPALQVLRQTLQACGACPATREDSY
ncbi:hypothetical protein F4802DRAFT_412827 [Xylaria palmicola]|nr:hypothetical protein F4802DRAFT_412827 [Xylaria palmicola]